MCVSGSSSPNVRESLYLGPFSLYQLEVTPECTLCSSPEAKRILVIFEVQFTSKELSETRRQSMSRQTARVFDWRGEARCAGRRGHASVHKTVYIYIYTPIYFVLSTVL
jgi:hypothetical protein